MNIRSLFWVLMMLSLAACSANTNPFELKVSEIAPGWAKTSVNAPVFRKNSVVSAGGYQYVAYYDSTANVVLAKRSLDSDEWEINTTQYKGNVYDAHNVISIMVDGDGYLHMSWDHHNNPLNYCRSVEPYTCQMGEKESMTGDNENVVSYPEFYKFSNGDLLFAYRDGGSGNGNLVLNWYRISTRKWERIQTNLIDGEGQRNAYWQIHIDHHDRILVSWVWRETPDVASNHDMCFARSDDGGLTWEKSNGDVYNLPINMASAEVIYPIPQNSNLINQTSITTDDEGNAYIAT
ncbi:MAG: BNR repeat-containing protein [Prolixibacteraceae bacterium]|nr:BNR repeat-containing protein [Prolixibacteraceae bacterium]